MNILPRTIFFSSLLSLLSTQIVWAEPADSYMDALSGEAGKTRMKDDDTAKSVKEKDKKPQQDEEEPKLKTSAETIDNNKLTDQVSQQLEKLLVGTSDGDVKQEDLANIVSDAVQAGHEIDNIHDAVTNAMTELREKEGIDIKAEVLDFSIDAVNEIVGASKDVAEGNVDDPYLQSLKAEAEASNTSTSTTDDKKTSDKNTTAKTDSDKEDKPAADTAKTSTDKKDKPDSDTAKTDKKESNVVTTTETATSTKTEAVADTSSETKTRTIIVLKGESLSKIAEKIYGSSRKYTLLYEANKETLKDPNNIRVGQILKVPMLPKEKEG
jgi:hypothetical protein